MPQWHDARFPKNRALPQDEKGYPKEMQAIHIGFTDDEGAPGRKALRDFGFDESFERDYIEVAGNGDLPARVVEQQRGRYGIVTVARRGAGEAIGNAIGDEGGETACEADAVLSGRLLYSAALPEELPAVGDWTVVTPPRAAPSAGEDGTWVIRAILPRRTAFARREAGDRGDKVAAQVLAANVDAAFIVAAADARWSLRRIERYITLAREAGVEPVVVVTKSDIADDAPALLAEARGLGAEAALVCAPEGKGLEALSPWLAPGRTVVLLGSSGAGKSTLLNALAGREIASTGSVRADDARGRHTTTHRELYRLASGALVIDSPGLREIQVIAGEEALASAFTDVEEIASRCRFRDCAHGSEPGCAVRAALESGELDRGRYEGWRKLGREVAFLASREDPRLAAAEAQRWKTINKSMRGYTKERRSIQGKSR
jgi:ribosome biogenesis GTPase